MKRIIGDDRTRLLSKIDRSGGQSACWPFTGAKTGHGYGNFWLQGKYVGAHKAAWLIMVGPVLGGLEVDHTCHNEDKACPGGDNCPHRLCVNWERHMRLVTHIENDHAGRTGPVDHCLRGHKYNEANTYIHRGRKFCRACRRVGGPAKHPRELEAVRIKAVEMRARGMTFDRIARELGYASGGSARNAIVLQLKRGDVW